MSFNALDNPVWYALETTQSKFGEGTALAKRFPSTVAPFAAMLEPTPQAFSDLSQVLSGGIGALVTTASLEIPDTWETVHSSIISQMICQNLQPTTRFEMRVLTQNDIPAMLELTNLTKPGPFYERTNELGTYWGIFEASKLVAMAGERLCLTGFTEVSAVCTHPEYQARGYAKALVYQVCEGIFARDEIPFLHVKTQNSNAIKTYQALGFKERSAIQFFVLKAPHSA